MTRVRAGLIFALLVTAVWLGIRELKESSEGRAAYPIEEGRIAVAGLEAPVEIDRDARGIPHISAESELDAYFGWGFAHAQDRLAQMIWLRRRARGRSAEVRGAQALPGDRWALTLGLGRLADAELERSDDRTRARLTAYAAGVNARIARIRAGRVAAPRALRGVDLGENPWQPSDALAIAKLYSWGLGDSIEVSLLLRDISERLGSRAARLFFPRGAGEAGRAVPDSVTARARPRGRDPGLEALRSAVGVDGRSAGSSAWVVAGAESRSGSPILSADAHLDPTVPPLLHVARVSGGELDVAGAAVAGVPIVWTGHNRSVAWASTHARVASIDLYKETLGDSNPGQYHDGRRWRPLEIREERIPVRGRDDVVLQVRSTHHGPLLNELLDDEPDPLSLAWVGGLSGITSSFASMSAVAMSGGRAELLKALASHHDPPLVVAYADREGGGVQTAAWIPERTLPTDLVPLPGRARWYDWQGRLAFGALPRIRLDGRRSWAVAADNVLPAGPDAHGDDGIEWLWRSGARAERIEARLAELRREGRLNLRRVAELHADVGSERAAGLIAEVLELAGPTESLSVEARDIAGLLREWDGVSSPDSVGAAAYHVFAARLADAVCRLTMGDPLADRYRALPGVDPEQLIADLMAAVTSDAREAPMDLDDFREAARKSLRETWLELSFRLGANRDKWRWGRLHQLSFRPFGPPDRHADLEGLVEIPLGGGAHSISAGEYRGPGDFSVRLASTFRMVVDAGTLSQAFVSLAPGQSEHPGHPHYRDGLADWLKGHSGLLVTDRVIVRESGALRLVLEPLP